MREQAATAGQRQKNSTEGPCKRALRAAALYDFGIFFIKRVESNLPQPNAHNSYTHPLTFTFTPQNLHPLFSPILPISERSLPCHEGSQASPACPSDNSSIKVEMSIERWWNDVDRGNLSTLRRTLSQCHLVPHKSHLDWPQMEPVSWSPKPVMGKHL